jgi:hypothetical protein
VLNGVLDVLRQRRSLSSNLVEWVRLGDRVFQGCVAASLPPRLCWLPRYRTDTVENRYPSKSGTGPAAQTWGHSAAPNATPITAPPPSRNPTPSIGRPRPGPRNAAAARYCRNGRQRSKPGTGTFSKRQFATWPARRNPPTHDRRGPSPAPLRHHCRRRAAQAGVTLARLPGEYRVNFRNGSEATAQTIETMDEAICTRAQHGGPCSGAGRPRAGKAPPPTAPHDAEGNQSPQDEDAQLPFARAGAEEAAQGQLKSRPFSYGLIRLT